MLSRTIAALKAAEAAIQTDLDALWVPYDPTTGSGAVYWHAAGSSVLQSALGGIAQLRADLEQRQAPIDASNAAAAKLAAESTPPEPEPPPVPTPVAEPVEEPSEPAGEEAVEETAETSPAPAAPEEGPSMPVNQQVMAEVVSADA